MNQAVMHAKGEAGLSKQERRKRESTGAINFGLFFLRSCFPDSCLLIFTWLPDLKARPHL